MPATTTANLTNAVKPYYHAAYLLAAQPRLYYDQFTFNVMATNGERGNQVQFVIFENLPADPTPLSEATDVSPVTMSDFAVTITLEELGGAVQLTEYLLATAYPDVYLAAAEAVGYQMARTMDMYVRKKLLQDPTRSVQVLYAGGKAARNALTASDIAGYSFFSDLVRYAQARECPTFEEGYYVTVVHPDVKFDLLRDATFLNVSAYQHAFQIYNGEVGQLAGVRICVSQNAKAYWGAGASSASTTLAAAASAGATTVSVASATGFSVGDWITIGSVEANTGDDFPTTERVRIVDISGTTLTIQGAGNGQGNFGLAFNKPVGAPVTKAPNVYAVPIIGPQSLAKVYSSRTGPLGTLVFSGPFDVLGRFVNVGWYWVGGVAITSPKWVVRGECSTSASA